MDDLLKIELNYKKQYSYGVFHSGFELFQSIYLENLSNQALEHLSVTVQTTPNILLKGDSVVDFLVPSGYRYLSCDFLKLDLSLLESLGHVLNISISVSVHNREGELLKRVDFPCRLLPYFYFGGFGDAPEAVSFFVTPDQEELSEIDVTGTCSDPFDFCHQLYDNIKEKKITFASEDYSASCPLPVRLPERVLKERFANSLELALLFASCCERNGLNPLIAFGPKGKAYAGFSLRSGKMELLSICEKTRKNLDDLYFIDGSYFAYGSELNFDAALFHSKNSLSLSDEKFVVLDIACARRFNLQPLPKRFYDRGRAFLSDEASDLKKEGFDDYYSLLNFYSDDSRILSILKGERLAVNERAVALPFATQP